MKKKIICLFSSFAIFFSFTISSFANPVAIKLSYEALMGILAIAGAYGISTSSNQDIMDLLDNLSIPGTLSDEEELFNEPYLKNLEDIVWNEYINRNNGDNGNNGDNKIQVPFVPGVKKLFDSVVSNFNSVNSNDISINGGKIPDITYKDYKTLLVNNSIPKYPIYRLGQEVSFNFNGQSIKYYLEQTNGTSCNLMVQTPYVTTVVINYDLNYLNYSPLYISPVYDSYAMGKPLLWTCTITKKTDNGSLNYSRNSSGLGSLNYDGLTFASKKYNYDSSVVPSIDLEKNELTIDANKIPQLNYDTLPIEEIKNVYNIDISKPQVVPNTVPDTVPDTGSDSDSDSDSDSSLKFPNFGDSINFTPFELIGITEKFPFSLAWDIGRIIETFDLVPKAPIFVVPLVTEKITIDLTKFNEWAMIIRYFLLISFTCSLIFLSSRFGG